MRNSDVAQTGLDSEIAVGRAAPRTTVPLRMIISKGRGLVMGPELAVADGALWLLAGDRGGVAEDARLSALAQICYFGRQRELHAMSKHRQFPSSIQEIALNWTFAVMGERRINRTYDEYMAIAARLPPLKVLTFKINPFLQHMNKCSGCNGVLLPELCRFEAGHRRIVYEFRYPKRISYETVRAALVLAGMRQPSRRKN